MLNYFKDSINFIKKNYNVAIIITILYAILITANTIAIRSLVSNSNLSGSITILDRANDTSKAINLTDKQADRDNNDTMDFRDSTNIIEGKNSTDTQSDMQLDMKSDMQDDRDLISQSNKFHAIDSPEMILTVGNILPRFIFLLLNIMLTIVSVSIIYKIIITSVAINQNWYIDNIKSIIVSLPRILLQICLLYFICYIVIANILLISQLLLRGVSMVNIFSSFIRFFIGFILLVIFSFTTLCQYTIIISSRKQGVISTIKFCYQAVLSNKNIIKYIMISYIIILPFKLSTLLASQYISSFLLPNILFGFITSFHITMICFIIINNFSSLVSSN